MAALLNITSTSEQDYRTYTWSGCRALWSTSPEKISNRATLASAMSCGRRIRGVVNTDHISLTMAAERVCLHEIRVFPLGVSFLCKLQAEGALYKVVSGLKP